MASASSCVTSLRLLNFTNSSRDLMIWGRLEIVNTVEPCEEKVVATLLSKPWMIVTTAITAATPTTMPTSVSEVRSLFCLKLPSATRKASHNAVRRRNEAERFLPGALTLPASGLRLVNVSILVKWLKTKRGGYTDPP